MILKILMRLWKIFVSLKLAVSLLLSLAASTAVGTILESVYDTPTAQYWTYRSFWFRGILLLLGVNIFCVAMSRIPWKPRHTPFLMAHVGILMMLVGSALTDRYGLDGILKISEGETGGIVELPGDSVLTLQEGTVTKSVRIPWIPTGVNFKPISLKREGFTQDLEIDQYLSHAEPFIDFLANEQGTPAVHFRVSGGPMAISQDMWLWIGDPSWARIQAGPAIFALGTRAETRKGFPSLSIFPTSSGFRVEAVSSSGVKVVKPFSEKVEREVFDPGWKNIKITFLKWIPKAAILSTYKPSRVQSGMQAPPQAIHVVSRGPGGTGIWLGLGERAQMQDQGKSIEMGFLPDRLFLPFSLRLERFSIENYNGTSNPASYSSRVTVLDGIPRGQATISMNEPLHYHGITFYQASYEEAMPRPVTTILSVNRDPGRPLKYWGSILIVLGSIMLFAMKYISAARARKVAT